MSERPKRKYVCQYKAPTLDEIFEKLGPNGIASFSWNGITGRCKAAIGMDALVNESPEFATVRDAKDYFVRKMKERPDEPR